MVLFQKSWLKTASIEAGIYRFEGSSIIISGRFPKRYRPEFIPAKAEAVCRHSGARVSSARCSILDHDRQIIPKYAVAHKALNPRTLGRFFSLWPPTFRDESQKYRKILCKTIKSSGICTQSFGITQAARSVVGPTV